MPAEAAWVGAMVTAMIEADVSAGLRRMGYSPAEVRGAMAGTAQTPPLELEPRMRAALVFLARMRATRCSDGPVDVPGYRCEAPLREYVGVPRG